MAAEEAAAGALGRLRFPGARLTAAGTPASGSLAPALLARLPTPPAAPQTYLIFGGYLLPYLPLRFACPIPTPTFNAAPPRSSHAPARPPGLPHVREGRVPGHVRGAVRLHHEVDAGGCALWGAAVCFDTSHLATHSSPAAHAPSNMHAALHMGWQLHWCIQPCLVLYVTAAVTRHDLPSCARRTLLCPAVQIPGTFKGYSFMVDVNMDNGRWGEARERACKGFPVAWGLGLHHRWAADAGAAEGSPACRSLTGSALGHSRLTRHGLALW